MTEILTDLHLPFLIIALILGYQISLYFFYLYFKERKNKLELNKILLAYGLLYGLSLSSVLLRTLNAYFIEDINIERINILMSYGLIFGAAISYLICISSKGFDVIIKTRITKFMIIVALVIIILIYIFNQNIIQLFFIFIGSFIAAIFLLIIHYRLIKISVGNIKKRILLFTIGSGIILIGVILEADEIIGFYSEELQIASMIFSAPIFLIGELIIFLGLFQFSVFLEFDWKDHLLGLYIIDRESLTLLYKHEFHDLSKQPQFREIAEKISKGIMGHIS
jgi:hypothetical protein